MDYLGTVTATVLSNFVEIPYEEIQQANMHNPQAAEIEMDGLSQVYYMMHDFDFYSIILVFLYYFIFAYLMYASLFAAIGVSVDNETDTQQFMLPVTLPLIAIALSGGIVSDPQGSLAFWFSIVPLTSPIIMIIRMPFIGFGGEVIFDVTIIFWFLLSLWIASKFIELGY